MMANIINKCLFVFFVIVLMGCSTIPDKVPKLVEVSTNAIDNQSSLVAAEWESAILAANSAKKLLIIINSYVEKIDQTKLPPEEKTSIKKFKKGYPFVLKQLDNVLEQKSQPQEILSKFEEITNAIRFANSYISKSADENSRLDSIIETITKLNTKISKEE